MLQRAPPASARRSCQTLGVMTSTDIQSATIHGESLRLPSPAQWPEILAVGHLDGKAIPMPEWIEQWLASYGRFPVALLGLAPWVRGWRIVPLLKLDGT